MENKDEIQNYLLDSSIDDKKVVSEKDAGSELRRKKNSKKIHFAAILSTIVLATSAVILSPSENEKSSKKDVETSLEQDNEKMDNRIDAKMALVDLGVSEKKAEQMLNEAEQEANQKQGILGKDTIEIDKKAQEEATKQSIEVQKKYNEVWNYAHDWYSNPSTRDIVPPLESTYLGDTTEVYQKEDGTKVTIHDIYMDGKRAGDIQYFIANQKIDNRIDAKMALVDLGVSEEKAEQMLNEAEQEANQKQGILGGDTKQSVEVQKKYDEVWNYAYDWYSNPSTRDTVPPLESTYLGDTTEVYQKEDGTKVTIRDIYMDGKMAGDIRYSTIEAGMEQSYSEKKKDDADLLKQIEKALFNALQNITSKGEISITSKNKDIQEQKKGISLDDALNRAERDASHRQEQLNNNLELPATLEEGHVIKIKDYYAVWAHAYFWYSVNGPSNGIPTDEEKYLENLSMVESFDGKMVTISDAYVSGKNAGVDAYTRQKNRRGVFQLVSNDAHSLDMVGMEPDKSLVDKITKDEQKKTTSLYKEYWDLTENRYLGFNPPNNTSISAWFLTGEYDWSTSAGEVWKASPIWREIALNLEKVIGQVSYEEIGRTWTLDDVNGDTYNWSNPISVYSSAELAITGENSINHPQKFIGATVGMPYCLVNDVTTRIENVADLSRFNFNQLAFPLVGNNADDKSEIIGFVNGLDLVNGLLGYLQAICDKEYPALEQGGYGKQMV